MMSSLAWILLLSGTVFFGLLVLFGVLNRLANDSWYKKFNRWADARLVSGSQKIVSLRYWSGLYTLRLSVHYMLHNVLKRLRSALDVIVKWVKGLERTNREKAKTFKKARQNHSSYLNQIVEHKKETALSDEEKKTLKESKLTG